MKALYRKYRPISLDTVVAQDQVVDPLKNALKHDKISHAYLFCGPRGTGKTSIARIFAHEINGFKYELEDSYIDIIEIDAASNTGVDNIRELREKAIIAPTEGKYKIYIIDEVHMLSKAAFNALLKIMEEPPSHVVFVMATTNPEKVPITITSRAQIFTFRLCDPEVMRKHLAEISKKEGIKITDDALEIIVERGGGSFRDSISLLDQISTLSNDEISAELVDSALGLPASAKVASLLMDYASGNLDSAVNTLHELINSGTEPEALATTLVENIVKHPTPETLALAPRLFEVQEPFSEAKLLLAFLTDGAPTAPTNAIRQITPATNQTTNLVTSTTNKKTDLVSTSDSIQTPNATSTSEVANTAPVPKTTPADTETTSTNTTNTTTALADTGAFLSAVSAQSAAIASILEKGQLTVSATSIDIYPTTKGFQKILMSDNNFNLMKSAAGSAVITVHEPGEKPAGAASGTAKNAQTSGISAIMGDIQEVIEDAEDPFGTD